MSSRLKKVLEVIGKAPVAIELGDAGRALLLPHGGRLLGLYAPDCDENFLWTNPALDSVETARAYFERANQWPNPGGDRTWLAPEAQLFISDLSQAWQTYRVPPELDPGKYVRREVDGQLHLVNRLTARLFRPQRVMEVEIIRSILPAANPLRHDCDLLHRAEYAGYTLHVSLEILSNAREQQAAIGLWSLLQLPHGGELLVATYGQPDPGVLFGSVDPADMTSRVGLLRYRMSTGGVQKVGIRAAAATGRAAYRYRSREGKESLVIRNFSVNPSGRYIDVQWDRPNEEGYCFQACNVSEVSLGSFSEVEHHVPAIGYEADCLSCADVSQTWAFRGDPETIDAILSRFLGSQADANEREIPPRNSRD